LIFRELESKKEESDSESESDEEEDEEDYEEFEKRRKNRMGAGRRTGVSAESVDSSKQLKLEDVPNNPKSGEERERIMDIVANSVLLSHLDSSTQTLVTNAMFCVEKSSGDEIIREV